MNKDHEKLSEKKLRIAPLQIARRIEDHDNVTRYV